MVGTPRKYNLPFTAFMALFTIFAIPIIIALPFLIWGFIGRMWMRIFRWQAYCELINTDRNYLGRAVHVEFDDRLDNPIHVSHAFDVVIKISHGHETR